MDSTTAPRAVKIRPESLLIQERRDLGFDFPLFYKKTIHPADCFHLLGRTGYQDNTVRLNALLLTAGEGPLLLSALVTQHSPQAKARGTPLPEPQFDKAALSDKDLGR